jgi:hypothetical protein
MTLPEYDPPAGPRLIATPLHAALVASQDNRFELLVSLTAPLGPGTPAPSRARQAPRGDGAWATQVRLHLRPSAGVSVVMPQGLVPAPSAACESSWCLPDATWGDETRLMLQIGVDRGLALAGERAPLLWLRATGVDRDGRPIALNAPVLALEALVPSDQR